MTEAELLRRLALGEDSTQQFKRDFTNADALATELAALANARGGWLFIGVNDEGRPSGLLFGRFPERHLHVCMIAAVCFPGTKLSDSCYLDSENIQGNLEEQYRRGMGFITRNLHHVQGDQGFNSLGLLEIPEEAFIELLVNALVHRDIFTNATIRLFVFADRVEIISPGHLPDSLTHEQILAGRSNRRNKVLAEHAAHILPYRGLGTGIPRALGAWPKIDLIDEPDGNQFKAVLWRPEMTSGTRQVPDKYSASHQANGGSATNSSASRTKSDASGSSRNRGS